MKRKKIEAVPWIRPEKMRLGKDIFFVAAADTMEIEGEEHLLVDIWQKGKYKTPVLRAAYTKKDWSLLYPQEGEWTRENINGRNYSCWEELKARARFKDGYKRATRTNTELSQISADKIYQFVDGRSTKEIPWRTWIDELQIQQEHIEHDRRVRRYDRRMEAMRQRHEATPEIPVAFKEWAEAQLADNNYLYYRKKGRHATVRCSHCGEEFEGYTRRIETYEGQFQHIIPNVENMAYGTCECCGARGMFRPIGRMKGIYSISVPLYLIQPYQEKDFVVRYFLYEKYMRTDCAEDCSLYEIARAYVTPQKIQCDYHKAGMAGEYWDDCNLYGMNNIEMKEGQIWPGSWPLVKDTLCTHTGLQEYASRFPKLKPAYYLGRWKEAPYIEVLAKCDLYKAAKAAVHSRLHIAGNMSRRPADILGVYPYRMKMIRETYGDTDLIKVLHMEWSTESHFTEKQIRQLQELRIADNGRIGMALEIMPVQKLINRIYRYTGVEPDARGIICDREQELLRQTAYRYLDYLSMRQQVGDDLTDSIIQCPRDLNAAHDEMVRMINDHKEELHIQAKEREFPDIRKNYRSLRRKYFWEDDAYIIRPARSAEEIIMEGRSLHHCVGGDTYLSRHNTKESIILFLRMKETPDVPYVTVEIEYKTDLIRQWYGIRDTKPDKETIEAWLNAYMRILREFNNTAMAAAAIQDLALKAMETTQSMRRLVAAAG